MTVRNHDNSIFADNDVRRLINNAFAYYFKEARLATMGGTDLKHSKYIGKISILLRTLTKKDGDLFSYFDSSGEKALDNYNTLKTNTYSQS